MQGSVQQIQLEMRSTCHQVSSCAGVCDKWDHFFLSAYDSNQTSMWQDDLIGVAKFDYECLVDFVGQSSNGQSI